MTAKNDIKTIVTWVAIDVAKNKHVLLIEYPNGTHKKLSINNHAKDFKRLQEILSKEKNTVVIGLEATAHYHRPLAYFLLEKGYEVRLISALSTARTREAHYNTWDKNDPKDAQVILHLLKTGTTQYYHEPLIHKVLDIQEISNTYRQVSLRKSRLQHTIINHYLPLYFPEAEQYFCAARAHWFAKFFKVFPCPKAITCYSLEDFIENAWDLAERKVDKKNWLKGLYYMAETSIGLPISQDSKAVNMFCLVLDEFEALCHRRQALEATADHFLSNNEDYHRLQTLPGIGPIIAMTILAEAGNLRRFKHVRQFLKYCGFDLCTHQSGTYRGQTKLSKRGNNKLRQMFWMAATVAIRMRENPFRRKYENYITSEPDNKDLRRKAYTAVAAKIARIAHRLVLSRTDYCCTYKYQQ